MMCSNSIGAICCGAKQQIDPVEFEHHLAVPCGVVQTDMM